MRSDSPTSAGIVDRRAVRRSATPARCGRAGPSSRAAGPAQRCCPRGRSGPTPAPVVDPAATGPDPRGRAVAPVTVRPARSGTGDLARPQRDARGRHREQQVGGQRARPSSRRSCPRPTCGLLNAICSRMYYTLPRPQSRARHAAGVRGGREERLETVRVGKGSQVTGPVEHVRRSPRASSPASRRSRESKRRMRGEKLLDDLLVLLGFARAGGIHEPAAGPDGLRRRASNGAARRRSRGRSLLDRRQRRSGSRRIVPRPEQGASTSTTSNTGRNGGGWRRSARTMRTHGGAARGDRLLGAARRAGGGRPRRRSARDRPSRPPSRSSCRRARRSSRAPARRAAPPPRGDELRGLVLHDERPVAASGSRSGLPSTTIKAWGAKRAGQTATPAAARAWVRPSPDGDERLTRSVNGAGALLKPPRRGLVEPVAVEPSLTSHRGCESVTARKSSCARRCPAGPAECPRAGAGAAADAPDRGEGRRTALTKPAALAFAACASARRRR